MDIPVRVADRLDPRLKLRHLVILSAVAEHGSVLRASERLYLTQPVVSRAIQELEGILGVPLFERQPRGMTPTKFGASYVRHAQAVLVELRTAHEHLVDLAEGLTGTVTIGSFATASTQLLPQAILELRRHRPELRVVVREGTVDTLLPGLFDGTIDLIAGRAPRSAEERLRFTELYSEPTVVVAGTDHPAARQPAELADLLAYPWVLPLPETDLRREIDDLLRRQGPHRIAEIVECSTIPVIRGILRGGQHLGVLPFLAARHAPDLVVLPTRLPAVSWSIGITTLCDRVPNPAAAAMLDAFTRVGAQLTEHLTEWTADYSGS